jgi:hypothetical protein
MATRPDAAAIAALDARVRRPIDFAFLDIVGLPLRVTNGPYSYAIPAGASGHEDMDGFTFDALDSRFVKVSTVKIKETGAETVTVSLSGLAGVDQDTMNVIGNKANFQGRDICLWKAMLDPYDLTRVGAIWSYHTGIMTVPKIAGNASEQTIVIEIEGYRALFSRASNRRIADQKLYDPADRSADLSVALANGAGLPKK